MAKRSRKKVVTKKKASWLDKIFSFKKIFVYSLLITISAFTLSTNSRVGQVAGLSTSADQYTKSQLDAGLNASPAKYNFTKYIAVELVKDKNSNGKPDDGDCLAKNYTIKINGKEKTLTQPTDCSRMYYKVTDNCNTVEFVKTNTANKYSFSYLEYQTAMYKFNYVNTKKKVVCGFPSAGGDQSGYLYNQVNFGVKAGN